MNYALTNIIASNLVFACWKQSSKSNLFDHLIVIILLCHVFITHMNGNTSAAHDGRRFIIKNDI